MQNSNAEVKGAMCVTRNGTLYVLRNMWYLSDWISVNFWQHKRKGSDLASFPHVFA